MTEPNEDTPRPQEPVADSEEASATPSPSRFPELEALQDDISRRIRDNRKFLDRFMDDDFVDDDADDGDDDPGADFEEL